jgi:hypothetical protein
LAAGGEARKISEGHVGDGPALAGNGFVVWDSGGSDGVVYSDFEGAEPPKSLNGKSEASRYTVAGDWVALVSPPVGDHGRTSVTAYRRVD